MMTRLVGVCSAGLLLAACGDSSGTTEATAATEATEATAGSETAATEGGSATEGATMTTTVGGSESAGMTDATVGPTTDASATDATMTGPGPTTGVTATDATSGTTTMDPTTGMGSDTDPTTTSDTNGTNTNGNMDCQAVPENLVSCDHLDNDPFHAFGVNCPDTGPYTFIDSFNEEFSSANNQDSLRPWRVAKGFGTAEDPQNPGELMFDAREGEKFLLLSTGRLRPLNGEGVVVENADTQKNNHNNFNNDSDMLPAPMSQLVGSNNGAGGDPGNNCDGVNDCSDSILPNWELGDGDPNDKIWLNFDVVVPTEVYGFEFDFVFFSAEWPLFVGGDFNDMFIAWSTSEVYTGNITFIDGKPLTVTSLDQAIQNIGLHGTPPNNFHPLLAGTGFETRASTGWFSAQAAVTPGEEITVAFALMDMGDNNLATVVALDNWRWKCDGCIPSEIDDCEVVQVPE